MHRVNLHALWMKMVLGLLLAVAGLPAAAHGSRAADGAVDVVFVIDNSGSMRKNDPAYLTPKTVRTFLEALPEETRAAIVLFDERARLLQPLSALSDAAARQRLVESLAAVDYRGRFTDSAAGIERAVYELQTNGRPAARRCVVFLTDGIVDTGDRQKDIDRTAWLKTDLAAACAQAGIRIFGIAFTENADFPLIQTMASRTGGAYFRATRPEDIADVLTRIQALLTPADEAPAAAAEPPSADAADEPAAAAVKALPVSATPPAAGEAAAPAEARNSWKFYLPLIFIIMLLVGVVALLVFKSFNAPAWLGGRRRIVPAAADGGSAAPAWELRAADGDGQAVYRFEKARVTVGRDAKNDLMLATPTVSNLHAIIDYREGAFFLEDQRSTNGTRLNEHKVPANTPMRLKSGDHIGFANLVFAFVRPDQIVSGGTVMLDITALEALAGASSASASIESPAPEQRLKACLEGHLERIRLLGEKYRQFVDTCFPEAMCSAIAVRAHENTQAPSGGDGHHAALIQGQVFYVICSLPVDADRAAAWFGAHHGGFTRFISQWIQSDGYDVTACDLFCVVTFGVGATPWVSMTVVPTHDDPDAVEIMSVNFLSDAEKAELGLVFDDQGRVL